MESLLTIEAFLGAGVGTACWFIARLVRNSL
jgi:hypothetical protein